MLCIGFTSCSRVGFEYLDAWMGQPKHDAQTQDFEEVREAVQELDSRYRKGISLEEIASMLLKRGSYF